MTPMSSKPAIRKAHVHALGLLTALLTTFIILVWNRHAPIQDAWFNAYGKLMREGEVPYRDFYCFIQPIPLLISRALTSFGDRLWVFRAYGALERLALAAVLYALYARRFSPTASACAAFGSLMFYQGFYWDLFFHYYQTSLLAFVLALLFALRSRDSGSRAAPLIAGIAASCSFFSKQSTGAFAVLGVGIVLALQASNVAKAKRSLFLYSLGGLFPIILLLAWLGLHGALPSYLSEIYGQGVGAKGPLRNIFLGFLSREVRDWYAAPMTISVLALMFLGLSRRANVSLMLMPAPNLMEDHLVWAIPAGLALLLPHQWPGEWWLASQAFGWTYLLDASIHGIFWLSVFWGLIAAVRRLFQNTIFTDIQAIFLASALWMYGSAISFELLSEFTIPAAGLVICGLMDGGVTAAKTRRIRFTMAGCLLTAFLTMMVVSKRYTLSYWWWDWVGGPVAQAQTLTPIPFLQGIRLDAHTADMYERIVSDVRAHTRPNDPILAWPFMPIFNLMADRPFATFAPVGFMDVCPDAIARADAARVSIDRPKIIIAMDLGEDAYRRLERDNRAGKPSGQRVMEATIKNLVDSGAYRVIEVFHPPDDIHCSRNLRPIRVLARVE